MADPLKPRLSTEGATVQVKAVTLTRSGEWIVLSRADFGDASISVHASSSETYLLAQLAEFAVGAGEQRRAG